MTPLLICEAGLHGEGNLFYYQNIVATIRSWWSGWPPIALKTQHWTPEGEWAQKIERVHGREPLACLSLEDHEDLHAYCRAAGILYGITCHDALAGEVIRKVAPDFVKLALGANPATCLPAVPGLMRPIIQTTRSGRPEGGFANPVRTMQGYPGCPNNMPWTSGVGYSCHAVPTLGMRYAVDAARSSGCWTIEVHVTTRERYKRPLPADMAVSLSLDQFAALAQQLGEIWVDYQS